MIGGGVVLFTRSFWLLAGAQGLQSLGYASMILFPLYLNHLGATRVEIGVIMAAAAVGGLISRPFVGWGLDRFGRKPLLVLGTAVLVGSMLWVAGITRIGWEVVALRVVLGAGVGTLFTGYFTLAADMIPADRRTEGLALFGIAGLLPMLVMPFADRLSVSGADIRWFIPAMGMIVLCSLILLAGVRQVPSAGAGSAKGTAVSLQGVRDALLSRRLWPVWLATLVFAGLVAVFMTFLSVVMASRGLARPGDPWLTYVLGAVSVRLFGATWPDRIGRGRVLSGALGCYILAAALAAEASGSATVWLVGLLAGFGHGYAFPVLTAEVVSRSPEAVRGAAMSAFTGIWDATKLVLPFVFGYVADVAGDAWMLRCAWVLGVFGLVAWGFLEYRVRAATEGATGAVSVGHY